MTKNRPYSAQDLREDIRAAEISVAAVRRGVQPDEVLELLRLLDRIAARMPALRELGIDLRAEDTVIETIHNSLRDRARVAVAALSRQDDLGSLRVKAAATEERWWWYLDRYVAESRARSVRRTFWTFGGAGVLLAVLVAVYMLFLRPDEATRLRIGYVSDAEGQIDRGDYQQALRLYEQALAVAPDDPELNLMVGMMHEVLEHPAKAVDYYARAEALYDDRALYLSTKSQRYFVIGWLDRSEETALQAIEVNEQYALAYCSLGNAYEGQGRVAQAIGAVQRCADLAREQELNELYVIAVSRLAMLIQMPDRLPTPPPQGQQRTE